MMRKHSLICILFLFGIVSLHSQQTKFSFLLNYQRLHPHIQGELYEMNKIQSYRNANVRNNGYALGIGLEKKIKNNLQLSYSFLLGMKSFSPPGYYSNRLKCFYLTIPIIARYKWQFTKFQPFLGVGFGNHLVYANLIKSSLGQILGNYTSLSNIKALSISAIAQAGITLKVNDRWGLTLQADYEQFLSSQITGSMSIKSSSIGATMGFTFFVSSAEKIK